MNMSRPPRRQISDSRKTIYYLGMALALVGVAVFVATFFAWQNLSFGQSPSPAQPLAGMGLIALGSILMNLGRHGPAGSGMILDPERARRDLEPLSRMGGGMLKDALDEAQLGAPQQPVVKLRCRSCGALDDETAKFCSACGKPM